MLSGQGFVDNGLVIERNRVEIWREPDQLMSPLLQVCPKAVKHSFSEFLLTTLGFLLVYMYLVQMSPFFLISKR